MAFKYDADGNFIEQASAPTTSFKYDADGNFIEPASDKPPADQGDTMRGFTRSFAQVPELAYGTGALVGLTGEKLFGEGGLSTAAKDYFIGKYSEAQTENRQYAPTVEFTDAWDNLQKGNLSPLADWLQDSAGYVVGQGMQTIATGGLGAIAGKTLLTSATEKAMAGAVAKAADTMVRKAAEKGVTLGLDVATQAAAKNLASAIGAGVVLNAQNLGMEAGDIYGGLTEEAKKQGREITGDDLTRAWGAAAAAAGTETLTDMLGLGALTGRIKIGGKAVQEMAGIGGRMARAGTAAAVGMPLEGGQEWVQTGLEQFGAGQPLDTPEAAKERLNAAAVGALGGGIMGGGIGAITSAANVDDAIAAADAALQGTVPAAKARVDEWKGDIGPTALLGAPSAGPTLQVSPDGTVATPEQMDAARLGGMSAPSPFYDMQQRLEERIPEGQRSMATAQGLMAGLAGQQDATSQALAADTAQADLAPAPVQDERTFPIAREMSSPPAAPVTDGDRKMAEDVIAILRKPADQQTPADTALVGMARRQFGDERFAAVEKYAKGPFTMTKAEQTAASPGAPITVTPNDNNVPIVKTQSPEQTSAVATALRDAGVKVHTVDGGNLRLNKNADMGIVQSIVSRINTQFSQPRGEQNAATGTEPNVTQGAPSADGQGLQGQEAAPEAVAVAQIFGPGARLRTAGDVQPGERVSALMRAALTQLGRLTGTKVVFVSVDGADGATRSKDGNTVYINVRSGINPLQVMGHETTHVLKRKHREAWAAIKEAVGGSTDNAALLEFARDYWSAPQHKAKLDVLTEATLDQSPDSVGVQSSEATVRDFLLDEMISDLGGARWSDPAFWENVFQKVEAKHGTEKAKGIVQRMVAAIKEMIAKLLVVAKAKGFAEFRAEGMVAQRVTPEQLQTIRSAIEDAYATFIGAERTNEPAGATATPATGDTTSSDLEEMEGSRSEPRASTIDAVPPSRLKKIKVTIDALVGDTVKKIDVSAKQALADINDEIGAYKLLLKCVKGG